MHYLQCWEILQRPRHLVFSLFCGHLLDCRCEYMHRLFCRVVFCLWLKFMLYLSCGNLLVIEQWILFQVCCWEVLRSSRILQLQQLSSRIIFQ